MFKKHNWKGYRFLRRYQTFCIERRDEVEDEGKGGGGGGVGGGEEVQNIKGPIILGQ